MAGEHPAAREGLLMRHGPFLFNPAEASTAQLDAVFVGRDALLQTILEDLRKQRQSPTTQHFLVIGPRGTGKTHLTELLARRLADAGEFPWRTVRLPEEGGFDGLAAVLGEIVERDLGIPRNWDAPVPPVEVSVEILVQRRAEIATPLLVIME
ncbi:MAG: AAA family ATPase, partial [bacterium]|nr:AAA family ATPase [bacterium]